MRNEDYDKSRQRLEDADSSDLGDNVTRVLCEETEEMNEPKVSVKGIRYCSHGIELRKKCAFCLKEADMKR